MLIFRPHLNECQQQTIAKTELKYEIPIQENAVETVVSKMSSIVLV